MTIGSKYKNSAKLIMGFVCFSNDSSNRRDKMRGLDIMAKPCYCEMAISCVAHMITATDIMN